MKKSVFICPGCGSIDIKLNPDYLSAIIGVAPIENQCNNCSYSSKIFPEIDVKDIKKFRKQVRSAKRAKKVKR